MTFYDFEEDELDNEFNDEFGDVKKKTKQVVIKKKPSPIKVSRTNVNGLQQPQQEGVHTFVLGGYLTWNSFFHLTANVGSNIKNALQSRGFYVVDVKFNNRDWDNSQYNFYVVLLVSDRYSKQEVVDSFSNALVNTVALPGSLRIQNAGNAKGL